MSWTKLALGAAIAAGLGAIAATIWVGAAVREDTVVEKPYEEGLRHDAEHRARGALGLAVSLDEETPEVGAAPLRFALAEHGGKPVADAAVTVEITRSETSRDGRRGPARAEGGGRFAAELAFPAPGPWDVRFDVVRGGERVRVERRVVARPACDLAAGPCARALAGGGELTLELAPRPLRAMRELAVRVTIATPGSQSPPHPPSLSPATAGEREDSATSTPTSTSETADREAVHPERSAADQAARSRRAPTPTSTSTPTLDLNGPIPLPPAEPGGEGLRVRGAIATPTVSFSMPGMQMGENRAALTAAGPDTWTGSAVLVRCPSGRREWIAEVAVPGRAPVRFPFTVAEAP